MDEIPLRNLDPAEVVNAMPEPVVAEEVADMKRDLTIMKHG